MDRHAGRPLFRDLCLSLDRGERAAIVGRNGIGKSSLLAVLAGAAAPGRRCVTKRPPDSGAVHAAPSRFGYVAQNATNWQQEESLIALLVAGGNDGDLETAARVLRGHRFPLALAARPLASLSPGERTRAALICLFQHAQPPELLILDEPTDHLDFVGVSALERVLARWPGALIVASHDRAFLSAIGTERELALGPGPGIVQVSSAGKAD